MSEIRPFRALRYDPARVELGRVLVPPYDVIAPQDRERLYARDPHCAVRLELTRELADEARTDYSEVGRTLAEWARAKVLLREPRPACYALRTRFRAPDGSQAERVGFFALLRLVDYAERVVRPHERTLAGPKADRLKMLRATRANLSSVFLLYEDREEQLPGLLARAFADDLVAEAVDEAGAEHGLARVGTPEGIAGLAKLLAGRPTVIADGHHRYETALAFRDEQRRRGVSDPEAPSEFLLAFFANALAPGNLLLPIHRLVLRGEAPSATTWRGRLPGWTGREIPLAGADDVPRALEKELAPLHDRVAFAADDASGVLRIFSRPRAAGDPLSIRTIHREVVEGVFDLDEAAVRDGAIAYPKDALQTARDLRAGHGRVALYLNPLAPEDVFRVTAAGEVLPQKSTFFYPKLPTGLVFRTLEEDGP